MRRFLSSAWYPFLMCLVLAGVTALAFWKLAPTGEDVGNTQIVDAFKIVGWAAGPVMGVSSLILIFILNGIRRIVKLRKVALLHPIVVLAGIKPWFILSWVVLDEPRFTPFARAAIDFVARPMLWGSLTADILTILLALPLLFLSTKKKK